MKINEDNYIARLRLRDERALEYVCDQYGGLIRAIVARKLFCLKNMEEDCINDVLYAVWEHIDAYNPEKNTFKNWLAAVTQYKCIDYLRKYGKDCGHQPLDETLEGRGDEPLEQLAAKELSEQMEQMLACLNEKDRSLFMKLYVEEWDAEQAGRELGMKKEAVYNRVSRAKSKIKRLFPGLIRGGQHEEHI